MFGVIGIICVAVFVILLLLFLLSVFGPMHSEHKFWRAIYHIRQVMDAASYWFFNVCAVLTILFIIYSVLHSWLQRG